MDIKKWIKYVILISILLYYMLVYQWAYSVYFIQLFTIKKYHHENFSLITTTPSYKVFYILVRNPAYL